MGKWEINHDFITYCVSSLFYIHDFSVITIFSNTAENSSNFINLKSFQYYNNMTWHMKFFEIYNHPKNIQVIYYNFLISLFTVITIIVPLSRYYTCGEYEQLLFVGNVIIKIFKNVVHIHKCKQILGTGNLNTESCNIYVLLSRSEIACDHGWYIRKQLTCILLLFNVE